MNVDLNGIQEYRGRAVSIHALADELEKQLLMQIKQLSSVEQQLIPHLSHSTDPIFSFSDPEDTSEDGAQCRKIEWLGSTLRLYRNFPFGWLTGNLSFKPFGYIKPIKFAIKPTFMSYGSTQGQSIGHYQDKKQMWEFARSIFQDMLEPPFDETFLTTGNPAGIAKHP